MTKTNWARTVPRLRKMAAELATFGFAIQEPADLETRPRKPDGKQLATGGIVKPSGRPYLVGESGPELVVIKPKRQL